MGCQPLLHGLGVVEPAVVTYQADLAPGVGGDQRHQEHEKVRAVLGGRNGVDGLAAGVVDPALDDLLFILPRSGDFGLAAHPGPHASQGGQAVDFDLVLKDQRLRSVRGQRFFLSRRNWALAFW